MKCNTKCALTALALAIVLGGCAAQRASPTADPRLSGLDVLATAGGLGLLSPAFSESAFDYTVDVQSDIKEVTVVPGTKHGTAVSVILNGGIGLSRSAPRGQACSRRQSGEDRGQGSC